MSLKSQFIHNVLQAEGKRTLSNQGRAIRKEVMFHSNRLLRDRKAEVSTSASGGTLKITVPHYNRLLDIKRSRKRKSGKGTSRRSLRIYNRFMMGAYYSIAFRLGNDLTDETIADIRRSYKGGSVNG